MTVAPRMPMPMYSWSGSVKISALGSSSPCVRRIRPILTTLSLRNSILRGGGEDSSSVSEIRFSVVGVKTVLQHAGHPRVASHSRPHSLPNCLGPPPLLRRSHLRAPPPRPGSADSARRLRAKGHAAASGRLDPPHGIAEVVKGDIGRCQMCWDRTPPGPRVGRGARWRSRPRSTRR